jgi:xylan 1,4-beta-xylosidase
MGSPRYPSQAQLQELRRATELQAPETRAIEHGELTLTLPGHGLALVELK